MLFRQTKISYGIDGINCWETGCTSSGDGLCDIDPILVPHSPGVTLIVLISALLWFPLLTFTGRYCCGVTLCSALLCNTSPVCPVPSIAHMSSPSHSHHHDNIFSVALGLPHWALHWGMWAARLCQGPATHLLHHFCNVTIMAHSCNVWLFNGIFK